MTDGASGTAAARPTLQPYDAIRALLRAGKNDEAIVKAAAIAIARPDDLLAKELLFDAFFQKRDWPPALALAEELARRQPNVARLEKALIATLSNMKRYDEAIAQAFQYIVRHGEDLTILDALKVAHFYTGKTERGDRIRPARHRAARQRSLPRAAARRRDRAGHGARRTECAVVFAVGHAAVLQLRRHDQSRARRQVLSGLGVPVLCRRQRAASPASHSCATTAATCATSRTNIRASACFSAFW